MGAFDDLIPAQKKPTQANTFADLIPKKAAASYDPSSVVAQRAAALGLRETGGYRTPQREDQLRAQGAGTVPPGHTSRHSLGSPDAPGAHDFAPNPGETMDQALDRARKLPGVSRAFIEGAHGSQGAHIHADMAPDPFADLIPMGQKPGVQKPTGHNPFADLIPSGQSGMDAGGGRVDPAAMKRFARGPQKPKGPGMLDRMAGDVATPVKAAAHQVAEDYRLGPKAKRGFAGDILNVGQSAIEGVGSAALRPAAELAARAPMPGQPKSEGLGRLGVGPKPTQEEKVSRLKGAMGTALSGWGGEEGPAAVTSGVESVAGLASNINKSVRSILAPSTVSREAEAGGRIIRGARGTQRLAADQAAHRLAKAQKDWGNRSDEEALDLIHHVETRKTGAPPPDAGPYNIPKTGGPGDRVRAAAYKKAHENTPIGRAADTLREVYQGWQDRAEKAIRKNVGSSPKFIEDYFTHLWNEDPKTVVSKMSGFGRQGSGRNFRKREIPTIQDGLDQGLTLKFKNPFEATQHYVENMSRFLTTHDTLSAAKEAGHAKWHLPGQQPEGWVPLEGILTERRPRRGGIGRGEGFDWDRSNPPGQHYGGVVGGPEGKALPGRNAMVEQPPTDKDIVPRPGAPEHPGVGGPEGQARIGDVDPMNVTPKPGAPRERGDRAPSVEKLYAHPDFARVYNNFYAKSLAGTQAGKAFDLMRGMSNAAVQMKLGLSAFHAMTMGQEGILSEVARAWKSASKGDVLGAGGHLLKAPAAPFTQYAKGKRLAKALLDAGTPEEITDPLMRSFFKSGQQVHMDTFYRSRGAGSFFQSFKRGSFKKDLTDAVMRVVGPDGGPRVLDRAKGMVDLMANTMQSVAAPLFEDVIPHLKMGAHADLMNDWIKAHPNATEAEVTKAASGIGDSIDNRFGELVKDNLFWHRWMKETAQIALTSFSWDLGTLREIGGGIADIPKSMKGIAQGEGVTDRSAYVLALATLVPLKNAIYQKLKTGEWPQDAHDLIAPRTGGKTRYGPERAQTPGYEKDVESLAMSPGGVGEWAGNKLNPNIQNMIHLLTDKDWRGMPIVRPLGTPKLAGEASRFDEAAQAIADAYLPISMSKSKKGTGISPLEKGLGIRPAPHYLADPDRAKQQQLTHDMREMKKRIRSDARARAQLED